MFNGDYVTNALSILSAEDPSAYAALAGNSNINAGDRREQLGVYEFDSLTKANGRDVSAYWGHDMGLSDEVNALFEKTNAFFQASDAVALVNAALAEKFGLGDTDGLEYLGDDGDAITIALTTDKKATVDTVVLHGDLIDATIDAFGGDLRNFVDSGDNNSRTAFHNTDTADGKVGIGFGGGRNDSHFDAAETIAIGNLGQNDGATNNNQIAGDTLDEFVFNALKYDGEEDVSIVAGGQDGDDFLTVEIVTLNDNIDTLVLTGDRVESVIEQFYDDGTQYDFFA